VAFEHWGHGDATEAARLALGYAFRTLALSDVVSFTAVRNHRSRSVMERLGMRRNPADDFAYPSFPEEHPLRRHVLYRLGSGSSAG
jgi:ribosomal-protein-alanine N-acetyltransferase